MPFFSIVIPTYNRADLLPKTLDTVLAQTFTDYEVIIVDNHSTDNTKAVIEKYLEDPRFRFIQHDQNYERGKSRNTGMQNATGKFVTFLDSDDYMYPTNLTEAYAFSQKNPAADFFQNKYELITPEGRLLYRFSFPSLQNRLRAIAIGNFISCIGVFISPKIYNHYRFDEAKDATGIEDYEFWIRVLADFPISRIDKTTSGIVDHNTRTIRSIDKEAFSKKIEYMLFKLENDTHVRQVYGPYLSLMRSSFWVHVAIMANGALQPDDAIECLQKAARINKKIIWSYRFMRAAQMALTQKLVQRFKKRA